jgi:uncharacterized protein with HEPN domain
MLFLIPFFVIKTRMISRQKRATNLLSILLFKRRRGEIKMDKFSDDKARLLDIAKSIDEVEGTVAGMKFEDFIKETDVRDDVAYMLQEIGGAARLLSQEFKDSYGDIDWDVLINLRFATYDQEMEIDPNALWYVIENDLPLIKDQVLQITTVLEEKENDNFFYF